MIDTWIGSHTCTVLRAYKERELHLSGVLDASPISPCPHAKGDDVGKFVDGSTMTDILLTSGEELESNAWGDRRRWWKWLRRGSNWVLLDREAVGWEHSTRLLR